METYSIEKLNKWVLYTGFFTLAVFIPLSGFIQDIRYHYQLIPFFISMVFLGLPHGAMDHIVPSKISNLTLKKSITRVTVLYSLAVILYGIWWYIDAITAFIFFIIMTWLHWGQGDLYAVIELGKTEYLKTKLEKMVFILVRGGIPMIVPLIAFPDLYIRFVSSVLTLFSSNVDIAQILTGVSINYAFFLIGGLTILNSLLGIFRVYNDGSVSQWLYNQFEVFFLWIFFLSLPPVFAVGLYFCLWHSFRHIARLSLIDETGMLRNLRDGDYTGYIWNLFKNTAPLTFASLVMMGIFSFLVLGIGGDYESLIAAYLVGISVLTLPHFVIVSWMDHIQKVWGQ